MKQSLGAKTAVLPLPAWVIGTYGPGGRPNAMTASWTGVCNSEPPSVYFSVRENRFTYECVQARRAFTVNIPGRSLAAVTDYLGIVSGRKVDKLAAAGLTAVRAEHVDAPYIEQFPLVLECRVSQMLELGSHVMCIGEIMDAKCDAALLDSAGRLDAARIEPFVYATVNSTYYAAGTVLGSGYKLGKDIGK